MNNQQTRSPLSILVATPSLRSTVHLSHMTSVVALQTLCYQRGDKFAQCTVVGNSMISKARSKLASFFLANDQYTHMLFVDDDISFHADDVGMMLDIANEADIVAAMCPKRNFNWARVKQIILNNPDIDAAHIPHIAGDYENMFVLPPGAPFLVGNRPQEVHAIGTGLMLISRDCLLRLQAFEDLQCFTNPDNKEYPIINFFTDQPNIGEDVDFCARVTAAGGRILGCSWPVVTHSGNFDFIGDLRAIARYV